MIKVNKREVCQIEGDYNNDILYQLFKEHTGIELEFEIDQEYGTECYGIISFQNNIEGNTYNFYPTLEQLEEKIQKHKDKTLGKYDYIRETDVVNYFRRKGILPEMDFLFSVDY